MGQNQPEREPQRDPPRRGPAKQGKEWILFVLVAVFIVVSIAGMMVFDHYGEAQAGKMNRVKDAADQ